VPSVLELIDAWQAAWSERDPGAFALICTSDVHYEDPLCRAPLQGPEELADHAARLWAGVPDARLEQTEARLTDGRYAVAPCRLTGTHRHELEGIPATGRSILVHVVFYCQLDGGRQRLWRVRAFFDAYDAAVQLGVLPRPGTMGERALMVVRGFGVRWPRRR
jgi:steroid delta-isomerase-like uncharacterized protein